MINSPTDLRVARRLAHLDELHAKARAINTRILDAECVGQGTVLASLAFARIAQPTIADVAGEARGGAGSLDAVVVGSASEVLWEVLTAAYTRPGFGTVGDEAFRTLMLARIIEPTSRLTAIGALEETCVAAPHRNTFAVAFEAVHRSGLPPYAGDRVWRLEGG